MAKLDHTDSAQVGCKLKMSEKPFDIQVRTFQFAVQIVLFCKNLQNDSIAKTISRQLIRSGTSIGANTEEAAAGESKADFTHKMNIALKEARETNYWLRLLDATSHKRSDHLVDLIQESEEIMRILGAIVRKSRMNR